MAFVRIFSLKENNISKFFDITLFLKAFFALGDILSGIFIGFIHKSFLIALILKFFQNEFSEDPKDFLMNHIISFANSMSINSKHFFALYLFSHGVIKLFLIISLLSKKLWSYPIAIFVFFLLIIYEIHRFVLTNSLWILCFALLDSIIILLAIREYKILKVKSLFHDEKNL